MKKGLIQKLLSVALATAMTASLLAGCAGNPEEVAPADTTTEEATEEAAPAEDSAEAADTDAASGDKVTISVYRDVFNLEKDNADEVQAVEDAINAYIADKSNVQIKLSSIANSEYKDKANLALSNGEINLLWTASWLENVNCDALVKQNAVYDLTPLLPGTALYDSMPSWVWDASAYFGKNYFVSCYKESAEGYDIMFRKDLVDKYGWDLSTVKSIADIEPMLADCKAEGLKYPYLTQKRGLFFRYYLDDFDFFSQDSMFGVDKATNEVVNLVQTPQYKEFAMLMSKWADLGYIHEDDVAKTTPETTTQTQDFGISWWTDVPNNSEANTRYGQEVVMVPVTEKWSHSTTTLGSCYCVTSNSTEEQARACVDFLGLLYTDPVVADLFTFGIEGVDYDKNADGFVVKKGDLYNHSAWESTSVTVLSLEEGEPADKIKLYDDFNNASIASCASGFRFDKTNIEAQYTACTSVFEQYGYILENGGYSESEVESVLEEYQAALDDAGYQDVLAEAQSQYEAWKASK